MGVQRTSFNHLLSGRNKPGFEFLTRLHACYPSVNLNWLISGQGPMTDGVDAIFSQPEKYEQESPTGLDLFSNIFNQPLPEAEAPSVLEEPIKKTEKELKTGSLGTPAETTIDRLIIIYTNGKMVEIKH